MDQRKLGPGMRKQLKDTWVHYYTGELKPSDIKEYFDTVLEEARKSPRYLIMWHYCPHVGGVIEFSTKTGGCEKCLEEWTKDPTENN